MEIKIPPSKRCKSCLYWKELYSGNPGYCVCHFCYITGKPRKRDGDKCYSFRKRERRNNGSESES